MLNVVMLNVVILRVVMLSVVVPLSTDFLKLFKCQFNPTETSDAMEASKREAFFAQK